MWPKQTAKVGAYLAFGLYSLVILATGLNLPSDTQKALSAVPVIVGLLFVTFDKWLWRLPGFIRFVKRPDLLGTWRGELVSLRTAEDGKEVRTSLPIVLVIRQSFTFISITLMSAESKSTSTVAQIVCKQESDYAVIYQYLNVPRLQYRDLSPIHVGGSELDLAGARPNQLVAEYWTGRRTRGTFTVGWISQEYASDFESGQAMQTTKRRMI